MAGTQKSSRTRSSHCRSKGFFYALKNNKSFKQIGVTLREEGLYAEMLWRAAGGRTY